MGNTGATLLNSNAQIGDCLFQSGFGISRLEWFTTGGYTRVIQQVGNEYPHAVGPVYSVVDELVSRVIQLTLVAPGQKLRVAGPDKERNKGSLLEQGHLRT